MLDAAILLAYGGVLLLAVLVSGLAQRSVLSTAVLFLAAGAVLGPGVLGILDVDAGDPLVSHFTELALFTVLFTEGMHVAPRELVRAWRLPGRALVVGMPLTLAAIALLARWLLDLPWLHALLLGAVLSPTDPVFAAALASHEAIPRRVRRLLNVESGLNDGLALPVIVAVMALISPGTGHPAAALAELPLGIAIGVAVPWLAIALERSRFFAATPLYVPLNAVAIGVLVLGAARLTHGNEFLAAFSAGLVLAARGPALRRAFEPFGEIATELFKLSGVLLLGALMTPTFLEQVSWRGYLFAVVVLVAVRPLALGVALAGSRLSRNEWIVAAWFGPRGFASMFYGLLVLASGVPDAAYLFHVIAVVVAASIVAHSSTDVAVARWYGRRGALTADRRRRAA